MKKELKSYASVVGGEKALSPSPAAAGPSASTKRGGGGGRRRRRQKSKKVELPDELWAKILEGVDDNSVTAFASVNKQLRRVQQESGRKLETNLTRYDNAGEGVLKASHKLQTVSQEWCFWSMRSLGGGTIQDNWVYIMNAAAFSGHLKIFKYWTHAKIDQHTCAYAALGGQVEVLEYLREKRCPWGKDTTYWAALGGHLEVLKYAHKYQCPWSVRTCEAAAKGGHLEVLKYLYRNGCRWNEYTCVAAAERGDLDMLKYAHEYHCPWNKSTCDAAARRGHL